MWNLQVQLEIPIPHPYKQLPALYHLCYRGEFIFLFVYFVLFCFWLGLFIFFLVGSCFVFVACVSVLVSTSWVHFPHVKPLKCLFWKIPILLAHLDFFNCILWASMLIFDSWLRIGPFSHTTQLGFGKMAFGDVFKIFNKI